MPRGILARKVTHILFIIVLGVLVYANSIDAPFNFDDTPNIVENPVVKDISYFEDTGRAAGFVRYDALRTRYIGYLTFFLNYRAGGLDVTGYHLVNILIHIINALLVYALVALSFQTPMLRTSKLFDKRHFVSLLAATLFVAHPVNTQAVTYIVQRLASLVALFYLGSMVSYIRSRLSEGKARWIYYTLALVLAVLAMKTKENAFTLPIAIALYEVMFFRGGQKKKRALLLFPFVLTMLIIPMTLIDLGKPASQVMSDISEKTEVQHISRGEYLATELRVMATYLRLLVLPVNQNLDYDYPLYESITEWPVLGGLGLVVLMSGLAFWLYRRRDPVGKLAAFGIVFYFLALSVESTVVPLLPIYEHRLYLPGVGMFMLVSIGAVYLWTRMSSAPMRRVVSVLCITVIVLLSAGSIARNSLWRDSVAFWTDVVSKTPGKARAFNNLASAYFIEKNSPEKAIRYYQKALQLDPSYAMVHFNLGTIYLNRGEDIKAYEHLTKAVALDNDFASAHVNLAVLLDKMGRYDEAIRHYTTALRLNPFSTTMHNNFGLMLYQMGKTGEAMEHYRRALSINPSYAEAHNNLGVALNSLGQRAEAIRQYRKAIRINGRYAEAYNNLGITLAETDRFDEAVTQFKKAINLNPKYARARSNLGKTYYLMGRMGPARMELEKALALEPGNTEARALLDELSKQ